MLQNSYKFLYRGVVLSYSALKANSYHLLSHKLSFLYLNNKLLFANKFCLYHSQMDLSSVIKIIEGILPKHLAEKWDNTGLLVDQLHKTEISTIFFTNDLTENVLKEALSVKANLIVSYHPPIFSALKSLHCGNWKDHIIMTCIAHNIAVYSPHTACDAIAGGVNDWLLNCLDVTDVSPIKPIDEKSNCIIECFAAVNIDLDASYGQDVEFTILTKSSFEGKSYFKILIDSAASPVMSQKLLADPRILSVTHADCKLPDTSSLTGMGRKGKLKEPLKLKDCIQIVKNHVKLENIRVALETDSTLETKISTVAVCAGSGASLLRGVAADLYITGEMSHHEILDAVHKNANVILCEHSNSERGYLTQLTNELRPMLKGLNIVISNVDKDPVVIL